MTPDQNAAALRTFLAGIGPLFVYLGFSDAAHLGALIDALVSLIGGGSFVVGGLWSWWAHRHDSQMEAAKRSIIAEPSKAQPVIQALREVGADVNTSMMPRT